MKALINAKHISKDFFLGEITVHALKDLSFTIYPGELIVILGPSGSGKSTLLNILGGIEPVTEGEIYYQDIPLHLADSRALSAFRRGHVGFVFQFYNLMPNLTALENVELAAEMSRNSLDPRQLLEQVELLDRQDHFPSKMSGGQQQRVAIARALCKNPDLLLCDEPTGALDIATGTQILSLLSEFHKKYHKTVIIITHNQSIAQIADRVFYFKDGTLEKVEENDHPIPPQEVAW